MSRNLYSEREVFDRGVFIGELSETDVILIQSTDGTRKEITYQKLLDQLVLDVAAGSGKTTREIYKNQLLLSR